MELIETLIQSTGLPEDIIRQEVLKIFQQSGVDLNNVSLDDIRKVMSSYMQDVLTGLKKSMD
jgi:hypothetical protein